MLRSGRKHGKKKLDSGASMAIKSALHHILVVVASKDDAPPHWIFAGPMRLFYTLVDKAVDYDWTMSLQITFWFFMLALMLKLLEAEF